MGTKTEAQPKTDANGAPAEAFKFDTTPPRQPMRPTSFAGQTLAVHRLVGKRPGMRVDSKNFGQNHIVLVLGLEPDMEPGSFDVDSALLKLGYVRKEG